MKNGSSFLFEADKMATSIIPDDTAIFIGNLRDDVPAYRLRETLRELAREFGVKIARKSIHIVQRPTGGSSFAYLYLENSRQQTDLLNALSSVAASDSTVDLKSVCLSELVSPWKQLRVECKMERVRKRHERERNHVLKRFNRDSTDFTRLSRGFEESTDASAEIDDDQREEPPCHHRQPCVSASCPASMPSRSTMTDSAVNRVYIRGQELTQTESRFVEYKSGAGNFIHKHFKRCLLKYTVGFLNSEGGTLYIGVLDSGHVSGIDLDRKNEDKLRLKIDSWIKTIQPPVYPHMYHIDIIPVLHSDYNAGELKVIEIRVSKGETQDQLYEYGQSEVYIRRDASLQGPLKASDIITWSKMKLSREQHLKEAEISQLRISQQRLLEKIEEKETYAKRLESELRDISKSSSRVCNIL
ncbi:uncharacterized protein LOC141909676 [Tubulanus polymorphus]|uniref:uncharacterized protein LOC141909676 n=1 Tax=Tubulanus polymorphus TaxID=672921 RepID=UPI003DA463D1